jgi:hypothetical protein
MLDKIISVLNSHVGYLEKKSNKDLEHKTKNAGKNNWTIFGKKYDEYMGTSFNGQAWCAMFVSYIRYHAGDTTVSKFSLCRDGVNKYKNAGLYKNFGSYTPKAGDIVFFTTDGTYSSHVGIVESVSNGKINTIEGNFKLNGAYQVVRWSYDAGTGKGGISTYILGYGVTP